MNLTKKEFQQKGEAYIDKIIGNDKVNMIVAIYHKDGSLLYENENAIIFNTPKYTKTKIQEWEDVETKDYLIKYLTVEDEGRIIKVGMVLNQSLLRWKYLSQRVLIFAGIILVLITTFSYFLTSLLFRPIQSLANHIKVMTQKLEAGETDEFHSLFHLSAIKFNKNDEFSDLLNAIYHLFQKISETHNITKKWSALMAHELKTPLTILKNRIESLYLEAGMDEKKQKSIDEEMSRMQDVVESFLDWASFESDPSKPEIHAVSIAKRSQYIVNNLKKAYPDQEIDLDFSMREDIKIFCNPIHFDQMLSNLISNSIKYGDGKITVECNESFISVSDNGPGIPEEVLSKLGSPFNYLKANKAKGVGLGLAWVSTICRKYGWFLMIDSNNRNQVKILFPTFA
ncbi:MAG: sensor histidine kinase [Bacteriovoracaceae bacterium]